MVDILPFPLALKHPNFEDVFSTKVITH